MTEVPITPPPGKDPIRLQDVAVTLQEGGLNQLATSGRALVMRGRAGILIASLETPNTVFLVRIEQV